MKTILKNIFTILVMVVALTSCSNDDENRNPTVHESDGWTKFKEITHTTHTIELYSQMGS